MAFTGPAWTDAPTASAGATKAMISVNLLFMMSCLFFFALDLLSTSLPFPPVAQVFLPSIRFIRFPSAVLVGNASNKSDPAADNRARLRTPSSADQRAKDRTAQCASKSLPERTGLRRGHQRAEKQAENNFLQRCFH